MEEALAIIEQKDALALGRAPDLVLEEAHKAAKALTNVIEGKKKKVTFNGQTYLQFEDWQTLGRFYGVTAVSRSTAYVEYGEGDDKAQGFAACADALLVGTNQVISSAEAMCLNDEKNWSSKPLFQLKSMAQTRACAKALRNVLAWVVVLAGYSGTPAEEMTGDENGSFVQQPKRKSEVIAANGKTEPSPEDITALFDEPCASPALEFKQPVADVPVCSKCGGTNFQPAGTSKQGKPYNAFCRDCAKKRTA